MRLLVRADGGPAIGGGHVMRCLTLAKAARARGHAVAFVCADDPVADRVEAAGFPLVRLAPEPHAPEGAPPHAHWLGRSWPSDAAATVAALRNHAADWLIWDHYGLDSRWVAAVRAAAPPGLRVLAIDDLDDRDPGSDLLLDQARLGSRPRHHPVPGAMTGPTFALLRPEFAAARPAALARRDGPVRRVLVAPGMMDAAGLAPAALDALDLLPGLEAEVVMSALSQSRAAVEARIAGRADRHIALDAADMAKRMTAADFCIGAGGMTTWERCCLGLPSLLVPVAENQEGVIDAMVRAGAAAALPLPEAQRRSRLAEAVRAATDRAPELSRAAAGLCDGQGAMRVLDALEARLRPVTRDDAQRLYDWRSRPEIRSASHTSEVFSWDSHLAWLDRTLARRDGLWRIYEEGGPRGFVSAVEAGGGVWRWSFYIGDPQAAPGAGGRMLAAMLRLIWAETPAAAVEGEVLAHNAVSAALHRRLGFAEQPSDQPGALVFRRERGQEGPLPQGDCA